MKKEAGEMYHTGPAPDDPEGRSYERADPEDERAIQARFDGHRPVVKHPTEPNTLIHDPGNFWDGPTHITKVRPGLYKWHNWTKNWGQPGGGQDEHFNHKGYTTDEHGNLENPHRFNEHGDLKPYEEWGEQDPFRHEALTLIRQKTSSFTTPGYYIVDKFGAAQDGPYNTYSLAIANLNGRDGIQYLDQPQVPPINEPFPPGLNTVFGVRHEAISDERINDAYERHLRWAKENGHAGNEESVAALRAHEKAGGITRAEANGIADLAYIGGGDSDWRSRKEASAGMNLAGQITGMKHGEQRRYSSEGHEFGVSYHERQAYGDNDQPVRPSDKYTGTVGEYTLYHPSGRHEEFHVGPSHEAKPYQAEQVAKRMMSHWTDAKLKRLSPKQSSLQEASMSDQPTEYELLQIREAQLLQAMASNPHEAPALVTELERIRSEAALQLQADAEVDLANSYVNDVLTPVATWSHHTSATDWLAGVSTDEDMDMPSKVMTAASLWYQKISPEVRGDREEFLIQAQGAAKREASRYGGAASEAYTTWMDHVSRIRDTVNIGKEANNETLLPWSAVVPPLPPSNPQGAEYNSNAVLTPGETGQPQPLSNDAENEFAFEPDSPSTTEAMGQAGDPNNTQFWPNADMSPRPNDSGSLQGKNRGGNPVTANKYIEKQGDKWVITQKGTGKVLSHHDSEEQAEASFRAMMQSKHGMLMLGVEEGEGSVAAQPWGSVAEPVPFPINDPSAVAGASSRENLAFYPNADATPEPNDTGADNYGGDYDARSGNPMTAAHRASKEHPTKEEQDAEIEAMQSEIASLDERRKQKRSFPESKTATDQHHTASANFNGPKTSYDDYLAKISEGSVPVSREFWSGMAAAASPNDPTSRREGSLHPLAAPLRPVTAGGGMAPSRANGEPQSHDDPDGSELATNPLTPPPTSIWQDFNYPDPLGSHPPGQMAETFSTISDFPETGPTLHDNGPVFPGSNKTGAKDDDKDRTGFETGNPQRPSRGPGYQPDRGLYAQSPQGQADSTQGYEHAMSSDLPINETDTGEDVLGTVPVQGYEYNADHPNGEMWPWNPQPPGTGAAQVSDVPAPGMTSQQAQGTSWPQPNVQRNARLDAFRQVVAERSGR